MVYDDGDFVYARNRDERVLFRFNSTAKRFSIFRSSRMTDDEKDFCVIMMARYMPDSSDSDRLDCMRFMNYEVDFDVFCS